MSATESKKLKPYWSSLKLPGLNFSQSGTLLVIPAHMSELKLRALFIPSADYASKLHFL